VHVESAQEMYDASHQAFTDANIAVLAAAVADYKPAMQSTEKIKKQDGALTVQLTKTEDILASLGKIKQPWQTLIGFALETTNELENARKKLTEKNADMIALNSLRDEGAGFGHETNKITLLRRDGQDISLPLQSKQEAAEAIVDQIIRSYVKETA
jgi:phosphopantothenoylcysteine decarboxylase/phosphopantothenate--cysteine ligase